jgi:hypothetical protein
LRDAGILYLWSVIQRTIDVSPEFLEHGPVEKIAGFRRKPWSEQAGGSEAFLHKVAQNIEIYANIQDQK